MVEQVHHIEGPVIDTTCNVVCKECFHELSNDCLPKFSLANGLWTGDVPKVLKDLTWVEKCLVVRCRVNTYLVQVSSGRSKIKGNVIAFNNPTVEIYDKLPVPLYESKQIFTVIYSNPSRPSQEDLARTPLLVRAKYVKRALEWLIVNHYNYEGVAISETNLSTYPDNGMPFVVAFNAQTTNKFPENSSLNNINNEDGVVAGECPFILHGLLGNAAVHLPYCSMTAIAIRNLKTCSYVFESICFLFRFLFFIFFFYFHFVLFSFFSFFSSFLLFLPW